MVSFLIRRGLLIIPTIVLATFIIFVIIRLIPGSVIDQMVLQHEFSSGDAVQITRDNIAKELGLDVPIYVQYGRWVSNVFFHGSFGKSLWTKIDVTEAILQRLPFTFELGLLAIITALIIALPIGIFSAIRQDTVWDYLGRSVSIGFVAIPNFWLATMVIILPALWWNYSPSLEVIPFKEDPLGNLKMFIVPALVLGVAMSGTTMRMTRTMMLEVLRQDYIRTAWAKGLSERRVVIAHVIRNAFIPVITLVGLQLPILIGGAVIIEQIFVIPGIGMLYFNAINQRDYPLVSGLMTFLAFGVLLINLAVDIGYSFLDPRIRYK